MDPETIVLEQPQTAQEPAPAEPAIPVAANEPEPVQEPAAPAADPAKKPWYIERLSHESARARQAEEARAAAERRAAEAEALARELQARAGTANPNPGQAPAAQPPVQTRTAPDFETAVQREAAQRMMAQSRTDIINQGYATFGKARFDDTANILAAVGAVGDDFLSDVLAIDRANAHKTLAAIASDPENASRLAQMDSRTRIAELARMTFAAQPAAAEPKPAPAPKQASKAPAPAPSLTPAATRTVDGYDDKASDEEFTRQFNERMKARGARRR